MIDCGTQPNFGGVFSQGVLPPRVGGGLLPPAGFMAPSATAAATFASPNAPPPTITRAAAPAVGPNFGAMTHTAATVHQCCPTVGPSPVGLYADPSASVVPAPSAPPAPFAVAPMPLVANCCAAPGGFGFLPGGSFCKPSSTCWAPSQQQLRCVQCGKLNIIPPGPGREFICGSCGCHNGAEGGMGGKGEFSHPCGGYGDNGYRKRAFRRGMARAGNIALNALAIGAMVALAIL